MSSKAAVARAWFHRRQACNRFGRGWVTLWIRSIAAVVLIGLSVPAAQPETALADSRTVVEKGRPVAVAYYPVNEQLEAYWVDDNGALNVRWKAHNGDWGGPRTLSGPGFAVPGAPVAAVYQPVNEQLEVFGVAADGTVRVMWKAHNNQDWGGPRPLTPPGAALPISSLAAVYYPINEQLEVYWADPKGVLNVAWKAHNGEWGGPRQLSSPGFAPAGAPLSAVYQPIGEQLEVYAVGADGTVRVMWKAHNGDDWGGPRTLTSPGAAQIGSPLSAVYQPIGEQLEVYWVDGRGVLNVTWKGHNSSSWGGPKQLSSPGFAAAGAPLAAVYQPIGEQLEVYAVGTDGTVRVMWKGHNSADWGGPRTVTSAVQAPSGSAITGVFYPQNNQLEVYFVDRGGALDVVWKANNGGDWGGPRPLAPNMLMRRTTTPISPQAADAARCNRYFKSLITGYDGNDALWVHCKELMGVNKYCVDRGGYPDLVRVTDDSTGRTWTLVCELNFTEDSIGDQIEHIGRGIAEGLDDALTAAAPFVPLVTQGAGCLSGLIFACATLALDSAVLAGVDVPAPELARDAIQIARQAPDCLDGDVVACAEFGAHGAHVVGVTIPGVDPTEVAENAKKCAAEDYLSCLRLGQAASQAAGVSAGQFTGTPADIHDCWNNDISACANLGRTVTQSKIVPLNNVFDGADNFAKCSGDKPDMAACVALGKGVTSAARP